MTTTPSETRRSDIETSGDFQRTDRSYRGDIGKFSAYVTLKECDELIEGFVASGNLLKGLRFHPETLQNTDSVIGLTGSIGRREAHAFYSDYDVLVFGKDEAARDSVISHLISENPKARFERRELFLDVGLEDQTHSTLRNSYYPLIDQECILKPNYAHARIWLLTEFTPLISSPAYKGLQETLFKHYQVFTHESSYATPEALLTDLSDYRKWLAASLRQTHRNEENEQPGLMTHAKTHQRRLAHLFNSLAVVRLVCRKTYITSHDDQRLRNHEFFSNMRAPTLIRVGYWFSDEFHHDKPMRRFDSEKVISASIEVYERYMQFLSSKSPSSRGRVIHALCESLPKERGLLRRLYKRTCVELIENYNESIKRIWAPHARSHLSSADSGPALILEGDRELDNIVELTRRVLWPLNALANLLQITFEVADEWGYFDGETYPTSGRALATSWLVKDSHEMLESPSRT